MSVYLRLLILPFCFVVFYISSIYCKQEKRKFSFGHYIPLVILGVCILIFLLLFFIKYLYDFWSKFDDSILISIGRGIILSAIITIVIRSLGYIFSINSNRKNVTIQSNQQIRTKSH